MLVCADRVLCLCACFKERGQCGHELMVRYLEGDTSVDLVALEDYTRGSGAQDAERLNRRKRQRMAKENGRIGGKAFVAVPEQSAWSSMELIRRKAELRFARKLAVAAKKKQGEGERRKTGAPH